MNILQINISFLIPLFAACSFFFTPETSSIPRFISSKTHISKQSNTSQPDTIQWTELVSLDSTIRLDLRYATSNNFVGEQLYTCPRCFLRPTVAKALLKVHRELGKKGLGLKMYDCYRPHSIQWALWKKVPDPRYVADPRKGSMHNRGSAVDLTVVELATGKELDMGTPFDYFGVEAYIDYQKLPENVLNNRKTLRDLMVANGFRTTRTEWWHFSYALASYSISNMIWRCP
ncbi:MAG: M15 family metallopeptidase [Haliscomenobacter sp.]|nr:M15 family metallopeptidase [Haliscomenobacter sp.]MBK8879756.1 M15 family metallopeptidase [Haliscomenobacter sp.]